MSLAFIGASYPLADTAADIQRTVNWYLSAIESGTGKSDYMLKAIPGLAVYSSTSGTGRAGGAIELNGRAFVVVSNTLYEITQGGGYTNRGTLLTSSGPVCMDFNSTQLVIVDGNYGYTLTLASNSFARITDTDFLGSARCAYLDQYLVFMRPETGQFYLSDLANAAALDALDVATAEGSPDNLVSLIVSNRQLWLFGKKSTEIWFNSGAAAFPLERNNGAFIEVGCSAAHTVVQTSNTVMWVGADKDGRGVVWAAQGYTPRRVSDQHIEEALQNSTDLANATAWVYQEDGHTFYCLRIPGHDTTLCFDILTQKWCDRADLVDGDYVQHRGIAHMVAFGKHLLLGSDGVVYEMDKDAHTNAGDPLVRDRISPHSSTPDEAWVFYESFELLCQRGNAATVMLRWSNDGGVSWGNWVVRSLGEVGNRTKPVRWDRLGRAKDRVWQLRCTDDAACNPSKVVIKAK